MLKNQKGSSLLEGLISIAIFSFGVLGTMSFQANMLSMSTQTSYRLEANMHIASLAGAINSDPKNYLCYTYPKTTPDATKVDNCTAADSYMTVWKGQVEGLKGYEPGNGDTVPYLAVSKDGNIEVTIAWLLHNEREKGITVPHTLVSTIHPMAGD